jgi:hypothetical protein
MGRLRQLSNENEQQHLGITVPRSILLRADRVIE